jgi:hypothetical protein
MHLSDLKHFLRAILSKKTSKISTSGWSHEATHRFICALFGNFGIVVHKTANYGLTIARFHQVS